MIRFAVVTKTSPIDFALDFDTYIETEQPSPENNFEGKRTRLGEVIGPMQALMLRRPVFTLGEIILLDPDGREVDGHQRKPDKWGVEIALYTDLDEAVAMSRTVKDDD